MIEVVPFEPEDYEQVMGLWQATEGLTSGTRTRAKQREDTSVMSHGGPRAANVT